MNEKLNIQRLAERLPEELFGGDTDRRAALVGEIFAIVAESLAAGDDASIKGLGRFVITGNPANPVAFEPDRTFAATVNAPFDGFRPTELPDSISDAMLEQAAEPEPEPEPEPEAPSESFEEPAPEPEEVPEPEPEPAEPEPAEPEAPSESSESSEISEISEEPQPEPVEAPAPAPEPQPAEPEPEPAEAPRSNFGVGFFWGLLTGLVIGAILFLAYVMVTTSIASQALSSAIE